MKRDKTYDILFWFWFAVCLLLALVLVFAASLRRGNDYAGGILFWMILTLLPGACAAGLKYLSSSENGKWYYLLPLCAFAAGCTCFLASLFGAVCSICPFDVWQQERLFFWNWFLMNFDGDLAAAAQRMMQPEVTGEIQRFNGFVTLKYEVYAGLGVRAGWILTMLFSILLCVRWKGKRFGRLCVCGIAAGLLLLGIGYHNRVFARKSAYMLDVLFRQQRECMEKMKKVRPAVPREKIVELIEVHARKKGFGEHHQRLLDRIEGKHEHD